MGARRSQYAAHGATGEPSEAQPAVWRVEPVVALGVVALGSGSFLKAKRGDAGGNRFGLGEPACADFCATAFGVEHDLLGCAPRWARCGATDSARQGLSGPDTTRGKGVAGRISPREGAEGFPINREATSGSIYGLRPGGRRKSGRKKNDSSRPRSWFAWWRRLRLGPQICTITFYRAGFPETSYPPQRGLGNSPSLIRPSRSQLEIIHAHENRFTNPVGSRRLSVVRPTLFLAVRCKR